MGGKSVMMKDIAAFMALLLVIPALYVGIIVAAAMLGGLQ
jgi:hypothetical protein